jgi:hypothetical protein
MDRSLIDITDASMIFDREYQYLKQAEIACKIACLGVP